MTNVEWLRQARQRFQQGKERVSVRKERALSSLALTPPRPEEISLIHSLYLESLNLKAQKDLIMQNQLDQLVASLQHSAAATSMAGDNNNHNNRNDENASVSAISSCSQQSSSSSSLSADPNLFKNKFKWMRNTIFKNVEIMFPQVT